MTKVLVLLSGGQDSATSLFWAKNNLATLDGAPELHALSADYGQRHHNELRGAYNIGRLAGVVTHEVVDFTGLFKGSTSALIDTSKTLCVDGGMKDDAMPQGLPTSFVPARNLLFLAAATARAGAIGAEFIVTGVCQTDYSGYPDCRSDFIVAMQRAIDAAWPNQTPSPRILTPLMNKTKAETVEMMVSFARNEFDPGLELGSVLFASKAWRALGESVTCYEGKHPGCGTCASCELRIKGFREAGYVDPSLRDRW